MKLKHVEWVIGLHLSKQAAKMVVLKKIDFKYLEKCNYL